MKKTGLMLLCGCALLMAGCADKEERDARPSFMFFCFRQEIVSADYHIPEMSTPERAAYIQQLISRLPGYKDSTYDLEQRTMKVRYKSSSLRKMNIEETISIRGFAVNNRPANPNAKLPEGL